MRKADRDDCLSTKEKDTAKEEQMHAHAHKHKSCQLCGAELVGDLQFFSVLPRRNPVDRLTWYLCSECRLKILNQARENLK